MFILGVACHLALQIDTATNKKVALVKWDILRICKQRADAFWIRILHR